MSWEEPVLLFDNCEPKDITASVIHCTTHQQIEPKSKAFSLRPKKLQTFWRTASAPGLFPLQPSGGDNKPKEQFFPGLSSYLNRSSPCSLPLYTCPILPERHLSSPKQLCPYTLYFILCRVTVECWSWSQHGKHPGTNTYSHIYTLTHTHRQF